MGDSFADIAFRNFIFPPGTNPRDALPPAQGGRDWADEIHYNQRVHLWEAYFGAQLDTASVAAHVHRTFVPGTFGLFVAWTRDLFGGHWSSRLLHYPGQFNHVPGNNQEVVGGMIDPSVDEASGQIVWTDQPGLIEQGQLTADGKRLRPTVKVVLRADLPWECHPDIRGQHCVTEGPVLFDDPGNSAIRYLLFNADGTWDGTYKTGVAVSIDPRHQKWTVVPHPINQSANGLLGPGIGSQPFISPDGSLEEAVHVELQPTHVSQDRLLAIEHVEFVPGNQIQVPLQMTVDGGPAAGARGSRGTVRVPYPVFNLQRGPGRTVTYVRFQR